MLSHPSHSNTGLSSGVESPSAISWRRWLGVLGFGEVTASDRRMLEEHLFTGLIPKRTGRARKSSGWASALRLRER